MCVKCCAGKTCVYNFGKSRPEFLTFSVIIISNHRKLRCSWIKACLIQRQTDRQREGTHMREGELSACGKTHISLIHILRESSGVSDWSASLQPRSRILATVMVFQKYEFPRLPETTYNIQQALNDTLCSCGGSRSEFSDYVSVLGSFINV